MLFGLFLFLVFHCGYTLLSQFPHSRRRFHFQETFLNPVETCPLRSVVPPDIGAVLIGVVISVAEELFPLLLHFLKHFFHRSPSL